LPAPIGLSAACARAATMRRKGTGGGRAVKAFEFRLSALRFRVEGLRLRV